MFNGLVRLKSLTKLAIDKKMQAIEYAFKNGRDDLEKQYKQEHSQLQKQLEEIQQVLDALSVVKGIELTFNEWEE